MNWKRVNPKFRCPICKHDSWCLVSADAVLCMRVTSDRSKVLRDGSTGYVHRLNEPIKVPTSEFRKPVPVINVGKLLDRWFSKMPHALKRLAVRLGVSEQSLSRLNCCFASEHHAWAFPMRDGYGELVGIRLRSDTGQKWAVKGSHQGIFLPVGNAQEMVVVCEGPTDTAAALTLGYFAIGRPSCSGGGGDVRTAVKRLCVRRAVLVADNDGPGMNGAVMLADQLPVPNSILLLPSKDIRSFLNAGGTKGSLDAIIDGLVWRQPKVRV